MENKTQKTLGLNGSIMECKEIYYMNRVVERVVNHAVIFPYWSALGLKPNNQHNSIFLLAVVV